MAYENDPDVAAFLGGVKSPAKPVSSDIAPKKSPFSGVNPQLQPDADVNYAQDPDVAAFLTTPVQKVEKKKEFQPVRAALETALKYKQEAPATAASALDVIAGGITGLAQLPGYALGRAFGLSPEEAQAASGLNHPSIITIHDVISEGDTEFMVMEYVQGRTLNDLIPKGGQIGRAHV